MDSSVQEIELLFPQGKEVMVGGEKLTIKPFTFGQFPKVLNCLKGVQDEVEETSPEGVVKKRRLGMDELVSNYGDKVIELCTIATGRPASFFEKVEVDQGIDLLQAILEVNSDFFVKRLQPKILGVTSSLSRLLGGASSASSLPPATTNPT